MLTKLMSIVLSIALVGTLTPSWAEDAIAPTQPEAAVAPPSAAAVEDGLSMLLAKNLVSRGQVALSPAAMPRLRFDDPAQASGQSSGSGELTTAGKVLKWVGVGLMATGGAEAAYGLAVDPCADYNSAYYSCTSNRNAVIAAGVVTAGVGAVLFLVGISKKQ